VLKHLGVLTDAGLVLREKQGRTVKVRLAAGAMKSAVDWLNRHERFWSQSLDRLVEAAEAREAATQDAPKSEDDA
jgi:DNA-binding transcriptional ArsR family regulator